jgi:hypothetical protein
VSIEKKEVDMFRLYIAELFFAGKKMALNKTLHKQQLCKTLLKLPVV